MEYSSDCYQHKPLYFKCTCCSCFFLFPLLVEANPHPIWQRNGFSVLWVLWWSFSLKGVKNLLLHSLHSYFLASFSVCFILMCCLNFLTKMPQYWHASGGAWKNFLWFCIPKVPLYWIEFGHKSQVNMSNSTLQVFWWIETNLYVLPHFEQIVEAELVCLLLFKWTWSVSSFLKANWHGLQWGRFLCSALMW